VTGVELPQASSSQSDKSPLATADWRPLGPPVTAAAGLLEPSLGKGTIVPGVALIHEPSRFTRQKLPFVRIGLCVAAAALVTAGCSASGPAASGAAAGGSSGTASSGSSAQPKTTSTVRHWGSFFGGPRGNFDIQKSPVPVTVPGPVAEVGTSNSTEYALLTNGTLYAWGLGSDGQLGDGRRLNSFARPVQVRFPAGVRIASIPADVMPYDTGLAVDTRGNVWGWGDNGGGELCLGNSRLHRAPVKLPFTGVTALAGASNHALYDAHGTVYACGQNVSGDLGDGSRRNSTIPVKVKRLHGSSVTTLVASFANSGALLSDGRYFDWGFDGTGQLGDGSVRHSSDIPVRVHLRHPVTQVAQGGSIWNNGQTLVMLSNGSLWAWGNDRAAQLGDKTTVMEPVPVRFHAPPGVVYRSLATGSATSYAISTTGTVYAWGVAHVGQVGDGRTRTAMTAVVVATGATSISATANNVVISIPGKTPKA
jgi:alpha-tubulin suppressor-like RCC1 family protein